MIGAKEKGFVIKIYSFMALGRICFRHYGHMAENPDVFYSFAGNHRSYERLFYYPHCLYYHDGNWRNKNTNSGAILRTDGIISSTLESVHFYHILMPVCDMLRKLFLYSFPKTE